MTCRLDDPEQLRGIHIDRIRWEATHHGFRPDGPVPGSITIAAPARTFFC
jgi:hypothetical protein